MNKAVFLDRDGTINIEKNYLYRIDDFEFVSGAIEGLKLLYEQGFMLFIITNQSGIARGFYTEKDFFALNEWMLSELRKNGIIIQNVYYCPHHPEAIVKKYRKKCLCRKPSLALFEKAIDEYDLNISKCWAIGNELRDISICYKYNCNGILLSDNEMRLQIDNIYYSKNLKSAADLICRITGELN